MRIILKKMLVAGVIILSICSFFLTMTACSAEKKEVKFETLSDFEGMTIGASLGTTLDRMLNKVVDGVQYKYYETKPDSIPALRKGDIDAFLDDEPVARFMVKQTGDLAIFPEKVADDHYGFMLKKNSNLTDTFSTIIKEFNQDGTIDALKSKWLSGDEKEMVIDYSAYNLKDRGNGVLRIVCAPFYAPLVFIGGETSTYQGYEIELLFKIADKLNKGVEIS